MSTWQAAQSALPGLSPGTSSGTCAHWSFPINRRAGSIMLGSSIAFIDAHRKSVGYRYQLSVPSATRYLRRPGYGIRRRWFWEEMCLMEETHRPWSWRACRSRTICSTHMVWLRFTMPMSSGYFCAIVLCRSTEYGHGLTWIGSPECRCQRLDDSDALRHGADPRDWRRRQGS